MTHTTSSHTPHTTIAVDVLYVVSVRDTVNPVLAGHDGTRYTSPPQPRDQALALVALLLGRPTGEITGAEQTWTASLAGGRRTITIAPAA
jgi:hypothetical protein